MPPPQWYCDDLPAGAERVGEHRHLAREVLEVARGDLVLLRDDDHAPAERAALLAERQVHVERQRVVGRARGLGQPLAVRRVASKPSWNSTAVGYDV